MLVETYAKANFEASKAARNSSLDPDVRARVYQTLSRVRESLHRSGRFSSRNEALDELTKLLFAHVMGAAPITQEAVHGQPAVRLRALVQEAFEQHLPGELRAEMSGEDFRLRIKEGEDRLAEDIASAFTLISDDTVRALFRGAQSVDLMNEVFGQFLSSAFHDEKEFGQYLTPPAIVDFMARWGVSLLSKDVLSKLKNPDLCDKAGILLDPSCGVGSFLSAVLRIIYPDVKGSYSDEGAASWLRKMLNNVVYGFDKSDRMIRFSLTNMALFGGEIQNLHAINSVVKYGHDGDVTKRISGNAQLILTNPPFGAEFSFPELRGYNIATCWATRPPKKVNSELLFMERYLEWLAPGGVLVAIVPDSILYNKGLFRDLREHLALSLEFCGCVSLPPVTFSAAGTSTKTSILAVKKTFGLAEEKQKSYFAICKKVGYSVASRGSQRQVVSSEESDLPSVEHDLFFGETVSFGRIEEFEPKRQRWDAEYHAGLPENVERALELRKDLLSTGSVADIVDDRRDPKKGEGEAFRYIEISDVDAESLQVRSKLVPTEKAPSRARRIVRAGDVLVSTVRPENRTIGVVSAEDDGAICTTGLCVLRPHSINSYVLARLLQSDFANAQIVRCNVGIAYPAIEEESLLEVVIPIDAEQASEVASKADEYLAAVARLRSLERELDAALREVVHEA